MEEAQLQAWLDGDSRRLGSFARIQATLVRVDAARALGTRYDPEQFLDGQGAGAVATGRPDVSRRRVLWLSGAAAASVVAAGAGFAVLGRGRRYETGVGEMRRIALSDGSVVNLNTASAIEVRFDQQRRTVWLDGGEVLFEVAKDAERPFVVLAGDTRVVAVGTAFTVRRDGGAPVNVVVREGVVEVGRNDLNLAPVRLTQNMQAKVGAQSQAPITASTIEADAVERGLFWREGKIGFSDATLASAAAEFARYNEVPIVIADPRIASEKITGLFVATDPRGFARAVATSLDLQVRLEPNAIVIAGHAR